MSFHRDDDDDDDDDGGFDVALEVCYDLRNTLRDQTPGGFNMGYSSPRWIKMGELWIPVFVC